MRGSREGILGTLTVNSCSEVSGTDSAAPISWPPGRRKSSGLASGSTHFMAVTERSIAEIPVVVDTWSMDTVNAVQ